MSHPSFLALDSHALAPSPEIAEHVKSCEHCAAHLEALRQVPPVPLAIGRRRPAITRYVIGGLTMAAAMLLIVSRSKPAAIIETITAKGGAPAVQLWVKRGDAKVRAWAGEPVRVGEAVRFEVAPAGFTHLTVVELKPSPHVLYEALVSQPTLTPAWALDAQGESEDLAVLLTRQPWQPTDSLRCESVGADQWCSRFSLHKQPKETP